MNSVFLKMLSTSYSLRNYIYTGKYDVALSNLHRSICHKPEHITNQSTNLPYILKSLIFHKISVSTTMSSLFEPNFNEHFCNRYIDGKVLNYIKRA